MRCMLRQSKGRINSFFSSGQKSKDLTRKKFLVLNALFVQLLFCYILDCSSFHILPLVIPRKGGQKKSLVPSLFLRIFGTIFGFFFAWLTRITAIHQPPRFPSIIKPEIIYTSDFVFFSRIVPTNYGETHSLAFYIGLP